MGASGAFPFGGIGRSGNLRPAGFYAADYCDIGINYQKTIDDFSGDEWMSINHQLYGLSSWQFSLTKTSQSNFKSSSRSIAGGLTNQRLISDQGIPQDFLTLMSDHTLKDS